jgi:hypothetical protein
MTNTTGECVGRESAKREKEVVRMKSGNWEREREGGRERLEWGECL